MGIIPPSSVLLLLMCGYNFLYYKIHIFLPHQEPMGS